jgi:ubiquinone/menaquinone biosynthesis C-methylase UbiE
MDRLATERAFHDRQARDRAVTYALQPHRLFSDADTYLDHETWIRPAFEHLGDLRGLSLLDYGCGNGMAAVVLAGRGARVTALDLSPGYLAEAQQRAQVNGVSVRFIRANGERLPLASASFDRVWGSAILHHLDLETAGRELYRVLRPSGIAVFCEPWGENPLLSWARSRLPYPGKERTPDETPLRQYHVEILQRIFPRLEVRGFQLLSMARRVMRQGRLTANLDRCDTLLLTRLPQLQRFCRYIVLTLRR